MSHVRHSTLDSTVYPGHALRHHITIYNATKDGRNLMFLFMSGRRGERPARESPAGLDCAVWTRERARPCK